MGERSVGEFSIIDIQIKKVYYEYLEICNVEISIPNLELLGITCQSVLDFQMRFFYELGHLLLTKKVFIKRSEEIYTYIFRITDYYALNNLNKIKSLGDYILNDFCFRKENNKRKKISFDNEISKKIKLLHL